MAVTITRFVIVEVSWIICLIFLPLYAAYVARSVPKLKPLILLAKGAERSWFEPLAHHQSGGFRPVEWFAPRAAKQILGAPIYTQRVHRKGTEPRLQTIEKYALKNLWKPS